MSTETILELTIQTALTFLAIFTILNENKIIRFERKVKKYVKAFLKAVYYTITKKEVDTQ